MMIRCSPYNPLLFFVILGITVFASQHRALAQCSGNFTFHTVASDKHPGTGKIEVTIEKPVNSGYTFKVFEMAGTLTLVQTRQVSTPQKVTFDNLKPSTYFIRIDWGASCTRTLGGFDGIVITAKAQGK